MVLLLGRRFTRVIFIVFMAGTVFFNMASAAKGHLILDIIKLEALDSVTNMSPTMLGVGERGQVFEINLTDTPNIPQPEALTSSPSIKIIQTPTHFTLTAITQVNKVLWAVGHNANILKSTDAGQTWQLAFSAGVEMPFLDILFTDEKTGFAIGAYGLFYKTIDSGNTWQQALHSGFLIEDDQLYLADIKKEEPDIYESELAALQPHLNQIISHGKNLWVVGEAGLVALSQDKGQTWNRMNEFYSGSFFDIAAFDNQIIVAGLRGNAFHITFLQASLNESSIPFELSSNRIHKINSPEPVNINKIISLDNKNTHWIFMGNSNKAWQWHADTQLVEQLANQSRPLKQSVISSAILTNEMLLVVGDAGVDQVSIQTGDRLRN